MHTVSVGLAMVHKTPIGPTVEHLATTRIINLVSGWETLYSDISAGPNTHVRRPPWTKRVRGKSVRGTSVHLQIRVTVPHKVTILPTSPSTPRLCFLASKSLAGLLIEIDNVL